MCASRTRGLSRRLFSKRPHTVNDRPKETATKETKYGKKQYLLIVLNYRLAGGNIPNFSRLITISQTVRYTHERTYSYLSAAGKFYTCQAGTFVKCHTSDGRNVGGDADRCKAFVVQKNLSPIATTAFPLILAGIVTAPPAGIPQSTRPISM
jgi:hypothetical protein